MELSEKYKIIAEFMDLEFIPFSKSPGDYGWWKKGTYKEGCSHYNSDFICKDSSLNYINDFNKLINVIKKIALLGWQYKIEDNGAVKICTIYKGDEVPSIGINFFQRNSTNITTSVFETIVEFIDYYNKNK